MEVLVSAPMGAGFSFLKSSNSSLRFADPILYANDFGSTNFDEDWWSLGPGLTLWNLKLLGGNLSPVENLRPNCLDIEIWSKLIVVPEFLIDYLYTSGLITYEMKRLALLEFLGVSYIDLLPWFKLCFQVKV